MCDASDPCCVSSPLGKAGCIAKGGGSITDPCSIMNPTATPGGCLASKKAGQAIASGHGDALGIAMIVVMAVVIIGLIVAYFVYSGSSSMGGGSRKFNIMKVIRGLRWK